MCQQLSFLLRLSAELQAQHILYIAATLHFNITEREREEEESIPLLCLINYNPLEFNYIKSYFWKPCIYGLRFSITLPAGCICNYCSVLSFNDEEAWMQEMKQKEKSLKILTLHLQHTTKFTLLHRSKAFFCILPTTNYSNLPMKSAP